MMPAAHRIPSAHVGNLPDVLQLSPEAGTIHAGRVDPSAGHATRGTRQLTGELNGEVRIAPLEQGRGFDCKFTRLN